MITQTDKHSVGRYLATMMQPVDAQPLVFTPIINTLGVITCDYVAIGRYIIKSNAGLFTAGKTIIHPLWGTTDGAGYVTMPLSKSAINDHVYQITYLSETSLNMQIQKTSDGSYVEMYSFGLGAMQLLLNIEVYNYITPTE